MRLFKPAFLAFIALGFVVSPTPLWAFFYYAGLAPLTLAVLWRCHRQIQWRDPMLVLLLACILWFALTLTWGVNQSPALVRKYGNAAVTNTLFLLGGLVFFHHDNKDWREWALGWLPLAGAVNVVIALFRHFVIHANGLETRMLGWAETRQEILGASIIAVIAIVALRNLAMGRGAGGRLLQAGCLVLCLLFVALSGSRGPGVALACAAGLYLLLVRPRLLLPVTLVLGASVMAFYVYSSSAFFALMENLQRPSMRMEIWSRTLDYVAQRPFAGHGLASVNTFGETWITFPHSMYFSALYYGGAVGLGLVVAVFALALWRAVRLPEHHDRAFLLALLTIPLLAGATDTGQFIKPPSPQWYIVWLPLIVATAFTLPRAAGLPR